MTQQRNALTRIRSKLQSKQGQLLVIGLERILVKKAIRKLFVIPSQQIR